MGQAIRKPAYTELDAYVAFEDAEQTRHELVNGMIYAMTGASPRHNAIAGNVFAHLKNQIRLPCEVFTHVQKLRVRTAHGSDVYYPDVMVTCGESDRDDMFREHPCVIIEVLSPSTERDDRSGKLSVYRTIAALQAYILVAQDMWHIEVFERATGWRPRILAEDETITVCDGKAELTGAAMYDEVRF